MMTAAEVFGVLGDVSVTVAAVFIAVGTLRLRRLERRARAHGRALRALIADRIQRHPDSALTEILRDEEL